MYIFGATFSIRRDCGLHEDSISEELTRGSESGYTVGLTIRTVTDTAEEIFEDDCLSTLNGEVKSYLRVESKDCVE
jgi:hypothetical protein